MRARELVDPEGEVLVPHDSVAKAARLMRSHGTAAMAIVNDRAARQIVGAVTDRELLVGCTAEGHDPRRCPVWRHAATEVLRLPAEAEMGALSGEGERQPVARAVVLVEENGRLIGVIESPQVAQLVARQLAPTTGA